MVNSISSSEEMPIRFYGDTIGQGHQGQADVGELLQQPDHPAQGEAGEAQEVGGVSQRQGAGGVNHC